MWILLIASKTKDKKLVENRLMTLLLVDNKLKDVLLITDNPNFILLVKDKTTTQRLVTLKKNNNLENAILIARTR